MQQSFNTYQKTALWTIAATLFLIFVGALVRASGAGLGCPDWPKCFGLWIPPVSAEGLPAGFDASQFNVVKTWTEYLNRLVGVTIGLFIIATFIRSFKYRVSKPVVFYSSLAAFLLVLFQGWLGGRVVETGLNEWLITVHMLVALLIVGILLLAAFHSFEEHIAVRLPLQQRSILLAATGVLIVLTLIQVGLGTQVREAVDVVKEGAMPVPRSLWLEAASGMFEIHRSFSWLIFFATLVLVYRRFKDTLPKFLNRAVDISAGLVVLQIAIGIGLERLSMPGVLQILHLIGVAFLVSVLFVLFLVVYYSDKPEN